MRYAEHIPHSDLLPYVKCIWVLEADYLQSELIIPDGCIELIFHFEDLYEVDQNGATRNQGRAFIFGQIEQAIRLTPSGKTGMVGVRFHPFGLAAFSKVPLREFTNMSVDLPSIWGTEARELEDQLREALSNKERITLLEAFLLKRIRPIEPLRRLQFAMGTLKEPTERLDFQKLCYQLNLSERQMERQFARYVGIGAKRLHRIYRLQKAIQLIERNNGTNLTHIAMDAGYYDQAHFNRDFKSIVHQSPRAYYHSNNAIGALFLDAS